MKHPVARFRRKLLPRPSTHHFLSFLPLVSQPQGYAGGGMRRMLSSVIMAFIILHGTSGLAQRSEISSTSFAKMISRARETKKAIPLIGVHDALSARIVLCEKAKSSNPSRDLALFVSGFGVSAARLGQPDAGILTRSDMEDTSRNVILSVPSDTPVILDGDTGYGGASNVRQTIRRAAALGATAISIEDQVFPKRCTYVAGTGVNAVEREEAIKRIRAAIAAKKESYEMDGNQIMIIARTDCRMSLGFDEAMARCKAFEELGADIVYAENLQSNEEYAKLRNAIETPMMLAQVQTGASEQPLRAFDEIGGMGYELALWGVSCLQAAASAMSLATMDLLEHGLVESTPVATLEDVKNVVGFDGLDVFESRYHCL